MATIHWRSDNSIKHMRQHGAALAVYWVYCADMGRDGVAWPSLRNLCKVTGWSKQSVMEARHWLVEHGALELQSDYVRRAWRDLPQFEQNHKRNLDKAEYYFITGYMVIDGLRLPLLYDAKSEKEQGKAPMSYSLDRQATLTSKPLDQNLVTEKQHGTRKVSDAKASGKNSKTKKPRKKDLHFETICTLFGWAWNEDLIRPAFPLATAQELSQIRGVAKQLRDAKYSPDDIKIIFNWCDEQNWNSFGPNALSGNASNAMKAHRAKQQPTSRKGFTER